MSPGTLVAGKYEVKGVLGEGGTGIVYDAVRKDDGAAVALKVGEARRFQLQVADPPPGAVDVVVTLALPGGDTAKTPSPGRH